MRSLIMSLKKILLHRITVTSLFFILFAASVTLVIMYSDLSASADTVPPAEPEVHTDDPAGPGSLAFLAEPSSEPSPEPTPKPSPEPSPKPTPEPTSEPTPEPLPEPSSNPAGDTGDESGYAAYSGAVTESDAVDDDYFADAVFIGDSRTQGFELYSGLKTADVLSARGLSIFNIQTEKIFTLSDGSRGSVLDVLREKTYAKIYIMLGINELGYTSSEFHAAYSSLIDLVRRIQPDAILYIQAIIPVSKAKSDSNPVYNNTNIGDFNEQIANLSENKDFHYIDTYAAFADANGNLPEDASSDGIHLGKDYCIKWLEYLKIHTVDASGGTE